jgi:hypothetical protein
MVIPYSRIVLLFSISSRFFYRFGMENLPFLECQEQVMERSSVLILDIWRYWSISVQFQFSLKRFEFFNTKSKQKFFLYSTESKGQYTSFFSVLMNFVTEKIRIQCRTFYAVVKIRNPPPLSVS